MGGTAETAVENKEKPENKEEKIVYVPIDQIMVPDVRVTSVFDPDLYQELLESIKVNGILEPVSLMRVNGNLVLVDGLHRIMAAKQLGIKEVPAIIREGSMEEVLIHNIIKSRQRGRENPAETAEVIKTLVEEYGYTLTEAAKKLGMSVTWAKKLYEVANLPDLIKDYVKHGKISVSAAYLLTFLDKPEDQIQVAEEAAKWNYTVEQMKARIAQLKHEEYNPEEMKWTFDEETGEPRPAPIMCALCGEETDLDRTYLWFHPDCARIVLEFAKQWKQLKQQDQLAQQPPQPQPTQQPQPQQPAQPQKPQSYWPY